MLSIYQIILLITICHTVYSATYFGLPKRQTDCSNGTCVDYCDIGIKKIKLLPNSYFDNGCSRMWCNEDFSTYIESCGKSSLDQCTIILNDHKLPYPDCCNKICVTFWNLN
ncbi:hypothetical protein PVAND_008214 [Polypedilum vanderplanki]|uniref:Single domain-containing protein n=1 Tax=Polypedilum vanderplanki TaxID=319348 RepID=A0A9J6C9F5_POLVA|nr:hypothetical protein PVAND_008214 [Polypedilum vanderplanki]